MNYRRYRLKRFWGHMFSLPFIWFPLIGVLFLDLLVTIYQAICFPIYRIEKVKRSEYILINDRNRLAYLEIHEKAGCMYCGYVNGFLLYAKEIAGRTEKYWCGVMHQDKPGFKVQESQVKQNFSLYGSEADFHKKYDEREPIDKKKEKQQRIVMFILGGFFGLVLILFLIFQIVNLKKAHSSFENYYAFRGCKQLISKTTDYGICQVKPGLIIKIVKYDNRWFLDGDLPYGFSNLFGF